MFILKIEKYRKVIIRKKLPHRFITQILLLFILTGVSVTSTKRN